MQLAKKLNCYSAVFTFDGNLRSVIGKNDEKCVYTTKERVDILKEIGVDDVYIAPVSPEFLKLTKDEFLERLAIDYNIKGYCFGIDFRFGNGGEGNVEYLKSFAKRNNAEVCVVDTVINENQKVSTTLVKQLMSEGLIEKANYLLGRNYTLEGTVFEDRKIGKKIGFPTVNLRIDSQKHSLKNGVYRGAILIDGEYKKAVINYGARPTFGLDEKLVEAHVIDFERDLYGKNLTVRFDGFIREIKKFERVEELKEQLKQDVNSVKDAND